MQRRQFLFWVSLGMFSVGEALNIAGLDQLAAATIRGRSSRSRRPTTRSTSGSSNTPSSTTSTRLASTDEISDYVEPDFVDDVEDINPGKPEGYRKSRHGRPPSRWLRSLEADELRVWLKTIEVDEAGVSGMSFWTHLTRDHYFDPKKIDGLNEDEQAKLHAAAHAGY